MAGNQERNEYQIKVTQTSLSNDDSDDEKNPLETILTVTPETPYDILMTTKGGLTIATVLPTSDGGFDIVDRETKKLIGGHTEPGEGFQAIYGSHLVTISSVKKARQP